MATSSSFAREGKIDRRFQGVRRLLRRPARDPRVWALFAHLRRVFRHGTDHRQRRRSLFHRLLPSGAHGRRFGGELVRHDEPFRPGAGRHRQRPLQSRAGACGAASLCSAARSSPKVCDDAVLPDALAAARHRIDDVDRTLRQDVERRDLLDRAVRQQAGIGRRGRHCGRGRQRRRGPRRLPVQNRQASRGRRPS